MQTLRNVRILACADPKDDVTRSIHVYVEKGTKIGDLSIYDSTRLVQTLERYGHHCSPEFYDAAKYAELASFAASRVGCKVDVDMINYMIVAIRDADPAAAAADADEQHPPQNTGCSFLRALCRGY